MTRTAWVRAGAWVAVIVLAAVVRMAVVVGADELPVADAWGYHTRALMMVEGHGFAGSDGEPTAFKPPLQSVFLAAIYRWCGPNVQAARFVQAAVGVVTCILIGAIGVRVWGSWIGWWATLFAALNPALIWSARRLISEGLFTCLLAGACFIGVLWWQSGRSRWAVLVGVATGLAALTRPTALWLPLWWCGWVGLMWCVRRDAAARRWVRGAILATLGVLVVVGPWTARNWRVFGEFIPVTTISGWALYAGIHPVDGRIYGVIPVDEHVTAARALSSEKATSDYLMRVAIKQMQEDPTLLWRYVPLKLAYFFSPFDWEVIQGGRYNPMYAFMIFLAPFGVWLARREAGWAVLLIGYFLTMSLATYGSPRLRMPIEPYVGLLASVAVVMWWRASARRAIPVTLMSLFALSHVAVAMWSDTSYAMARQWLVARGWW